MTPEMALVIAQLLLKYGPPTALAIAELFQKKEHSLEDWQKIFGQVRTYEQIVADPSQPQKV